MSSDEDVQNGDPALQEPELLFMKDIDGQRLFVSRLDVGKRVSRWKKMKKDKRKKKRAEQTLRSLQNGEIETKVMENEIDDMVKEGKVVGQLEKIDGENSSPREENIEGAAFFYGLPSSFATSKHIARTSSSDEKRNRFSSRSNSMESMGEVDEENEEGEQPDPLPLADSAPSATAIPEDYQWNSWDEYYAYFYGCYGRYPSEEELQSFMNQSDRAVAQSNSHLVFDESGAQESAENVTAGSISMSKRKNRKKRKREPPTTAPVEDNTDLAGEDENEYYQEEEYYEEEEYHPPVSKTNLKYWYQRYSLFSKWDEGIELDEEGWFSVTPESIARHIAAKCRKALMPPGSSRGRAPGIVVDAMCGPGGNSIQFASRFGLTLACDIDPQKIRLAKNNATVYGVQNDIDFIIGDFTRVCRAIKADAVFLSPPWGGPQYIHQDKFDIHSMTPDGFDLFNMSAGVSKNIAYLLPRNTDPIQMLQLAGLNEACEIEQNCTRRPKELCHLSENPYAAFATPADINGKFKTITAYYGKFVDLSKPSLKPEDDVDKNSSENVVEEAE